MKFLVFKVSLQDFTPRRHAPLKDSTPHFKLRPSLHVAFPKTNTNRFAANEFWSLVDRRRPELHNRIMYFENVTVVDPDKTYLTEFFYKNACRKISIHYILMIRYLSSNRAWLPGCLLVRLEPLLEQIIIITMKKGIVFQAGQWAALSSFKVRKK